MIEATDHLQKLSQAAQALEYRHQVLSSNLANVNTPGFKRHDVNFDAYMKAADQGELYRHGELAKGINEAEPQYLRVDRNGVDPDREMSELSKNSLMHRAMTEILQSQVRLISTSIRGR